MDYLIGICAQAFANRPLDFFPLTLEYFSHFFETGVLVSAVLEFDLQSSHLGGPLMLNILCPFSFRFQTRLEHLPSLFSQRRGNLTSGLESFHVTKHAWEKWRIEILTPAFNFRFASRFCFVGIANVSLRSKTLSNVRRRILRGHVTICRRSRILLRILGSLFELVSNQTARDNVRLVGNV